MIARDIMEPAVITVGPQTTIKELADILLENKISGVPVVDEEGNILGIVTEGDLLHKEVNPHVPAALSATYGFGGLASLKDYEKYLSDVKKLSACTAEEIMTTKLYTVQETASVKEIADVMVTNNINRVPVLVGKRLVGIISRADIIKTLA